MQKFQEKVKELLLLTDDEVQLLLKGDFKSLLSQNREATVRVAIGYAGILASMLLFLALFSVFGVLMKMLLSLILFGALGAVYYVAGKENILKATRYPIFSYFLIFLFGLMTFSMVSDIAGQGSFLSKFFLLMILGGLGFGAYSIRSKAAELGLSVIQITLAALILSSFVLSFQAAFVQFGMDREIAFAQRREENRRLRETEEMRRSVAISKPCATDEECKKFNTKKNKYYAENEEVAQEVCERTVSKDIQSRFEWTVGAKEYKFTSYQVDVLKDEIVLMGDRAQLIDANGIRTKISYTCRFNVKAKTAVATILK